MPPASCAVSGSAVAALPEGPQQAPDDRLTRRAITGRLISVTSDPERKAIAHVAHKLSIQFPNVAPAVVARVVRDTHDSYRAHPTRDFVPILVENAARDRLSIIGPTA